MGVIWWIYGIGMKGEEPSWHVVEVNYTDDDFTGLAEAQHRARRRTSPPSATCRPPQEILAEDPEHRRGDPAARPRARGRARGAGRRTSPSARSSRCAPSSPRSTTSRTRSTAGRCCRVSDRQRGDAVGDRRRLPRPRRPRPLRALGRLPRARRLLHRRQGRRATTTPIVGPHHAQARRRSLQLQHPTHYAVVQVRPVEDVRRPCRARRRRRR